MCQGSDRGQGDGGDAVLLKYGDNFSYFYNNDGGDST